MKTHSNQRENVELGERKTFFKIPEVKAKILVLKTGNIQAFLMSELFCLKLHGN